MPNDSPPKDGPSTSINWDLLSVEIGFVVGFGIVVGPLLFCKARVNVSVV